jgi:hypothetical protein
MGDLHPGQASSGALLALLHLPPRRESGGAELLECGAHAAWRVAAGEQIGAGEDGDGDRDGHQGCTASSADHRRGARADLTDEFGMTLREAVRACRLPELAVNDDDVVPPPP